MKHSHASCVAVPQFDRLRYFYGQMLHARDLQAEQAYFREKLKLHNRCLHGWGVVCGLEVTPPPVDPDCVPKDEIEYRRLAGAIAKWTVELAKATDDARKTAIDKEIEKLRSEQAVVGPPVDCAPPDLRTRIQIACGLAIDCEGNELVVRQPFLVDVWSALSPEDRRELESGEEHPIYVGLCYRECPIDPVRPVVPDACGSSSDCDYGKLRDSVSVTVTIDGDRWTDNRCDPCCEACGERCVLVARIDNFVKGEPLTPQQIDSYVHRQISLRPVTKIKGINWVQDGVYSPAEAATLLGATNTNSGGLTIQFSRPLRTETIVDGTVDVWVVEGGRGRSAAISNKAGKLILEATPTADSLIFRDDTGESLNYGDRVLITVRSAFLLDDCCRPVDGAHVGGRVPLLPNSATVKRKAEQKECVTPPGGGRWMSGAGEASNFESWFWIDKK